MSPLVAGLLLLFVKTFFKASAARAPTAALLIPTTLIFSILLFE